MSEFQPGMETKFPLKKENSKLRCFIYLFKPNRSHQFSNFLNHCFEVLNSQLGFSYFSVNFSSSFIPSLLQSEMLQSSIHSSSQSYNFRNPPLMENHQSNSSGFLEDEEQVLFPLAMRRETLYGDGYNEMQQEDDEEMVLTLAASMEALMTNDASTSTEMDEDSSMMYESSSQEICLMEEKRITYPALPEEPKTGDRKLVCRVGFWLPQDGRRVQRSFLRTDPIQLLWSFISSQFDELENNRPFRLTVPQGILGTASIVLDYECKLCFDETGLSNSMILVTWDDD